MGHARIEDELRSAVGAGGCPLCRLLRDDEERYWAFFLYEGFQDPDAERRLARSVGYCPRHLAQLARRHDPFAAASLALASVRGALAALEGRRAPPPPASACPVCSSLATAEALAVRALVPLLEGDAEAQAAYAAGEGLCYDHLGLVAEVHGRRARALLEQGRRTLERHREALERLIASFDYRAQAPDREQAGAWRRAFAALRGEPGRVGRGRSLGRR